MTEVIRMRSRASRWIAVPAVLLFLVLAPTAEGCEVGAKVEVEMIDGSVGTITAIGTEAPHVGWYRIVYDWNVRGGNPDGEWYSPKTREITVAGTKTRCGAAGSAAQATRPQEKANAPAAPGQRAAGKNPAQPAGKTMVQPAGKKAVPDGCPMNEPAGDSARTARPSAQLFQRVIYESMAGKVNPKSISAPKKIGLTFLDFEMGKAYKNTLTGDRVDPRLHDGAPVGAMIYPVKTKYLRCELFDSEIYGYVRQTDYACFRNSDGEWDCPVDSTTRTLERRTIPLK